jgi:hypothetical protein
VRKEIDTLPRSAQCFFRYILLEGFVTRDNAGDRKLLAGI